MVNYFGFKVTDIRYYTLFLMNVNIFYDEFFSPLLRSQW